MIFVQLASAATLFAKFHANTRKLLSSALTANKILFNISHETSLSTKTVSYSPGMKGLFTSTSI